MANPLYNASDWRVIDIAPEYAVRRDGTVMRIVPRARTRAGKIMKPWFKDGYPVVGLRHNGAVVKNLVHRLVCKAFHGPKPTPHHEVAHNDGCPSNPHADNLRWATHVENLADKKLHGTSYPHYTKLTEAEVRDIRSRPRHWGMMKDLAAEFGVSERAIADIRKGRTWGFLS